MNVSDKFVRRGILCIEAEAENFISSYLEALTRMWRRAALADRQRNAQTQFHCGEMASQTAPDGSPCSAAMTINFAPALPLTDVLRQYCRQYRSPNPP
jgi:hypothetical protein